PRHVGGRADPGGRRRRPAQEVVAPLLGSPGHRRELALEPIHAGAKAREVILARIKLTSLKLANRSEHCMEGSSPLPQHALMLPNIRSGRNSLQAKFHPSKTISPARPPGHPSPPRRPFP